VVIIIPKRNAKPEAVPAIIQTVIREFFS